MRIILLIIITALFGCSTVKYVPVETVKRDSIYQNKIQVDSLYIRDSIYVDRSGDTVYLYKYKYVYKYRNLRDTAYISRIDSIQVPYPVVTEKITNRLTPWQRFIQGLGYICMGAIIGFAAFRMFRK